MVSVAYGQGRIQGVGLRGICILPPAFFKNVFDEYNSSVIFKLFDNNKPYALSTRNQKCANKMHYTVAKRVKKFNKICVKIIQNALR